MDSEVVINVDHVSKDFLLPHEKITSVKGMIVSMAKGKTWKTKEVQHALRDVSFEIKKGEFFGIVGRNGSGKSTLLKMLAGIYQPTEGKISTVGKIVAFIELGVGFNGELTGRENVYLNGAMLGFSRKEIEAMYDDIVNFAELEQFMDQKLKNYSSGMQVRLAFSMATRSEADILLVDEVLAVGDADFQRKCFGYFKQLKHDKKTVVFVTHDMGAVREYCDRAIMIEKSHIVKQGTPEAVAQEYTKLFMKTDEKARRRQTNNRWGEGHIYHDKVTISPKVAKPGDSIQISVELTAEDAVDSPIYGFSIKNTGGDYIMGTNTKIQNQPTHNVVAGSKVKLSWEIPNIFGDGTYFVSTAVGKRDGVTTLDWWEEAASFSVFRDEKTPYLITPDINVKITEA